METLVETTLATEDTPGLDEQGFSIDQLHALIREEFVTHLSSVGLADACQSSGNRPASKARVRSFHASQRSEYRLRERRFVAQYGRELLRDFANGCDINPDRVDPYIQMVSSGTRDGDVFRLATLLWSVPVSRGYGRRMRFLVRDRANGKVVGLFALTDPVFNLRARDTWIGWSVSERKQHLVNVMDAYVVGAVPPYSQLLGGKVVAALATSQEVCTMFHEKYTDTEGIISKQRKAAHLALITVTSALGRSSLYNRLSLPGVVDYVRIGMTEGWGHFQVPERLFRYMRQLLDLEGHRYAAGYGFGQGPNWRMRVVREALKQVGLDQNLLRHGVSREIYAAPLTPDWREVLTGRMPSHIAERPSASDIGRLAVARWLVPRAQRRPEYQDWTREDTWHALTGEASASM